LEIGLRFSPGLPPGLLNPAPVPNRLFRLAEFVSNDSNGLYTLCTACAGSASLLQVMSLFQDHQWPCKRPITCYETLNPHQTVCSGEPNLYRTALLQFGCISDIDYIQYFPLGRFNGSSEGRNAIQKLGEPSDWA